MAQIHLPRIDSASETKLQVNVFCRLLHFSITCELCSSRRIRQNSFYAAVNHVADLSGNKYDISERSTGHAPGS